MLVICCVSFLLGIPWIYPWMIVASYLCYFVGCLLLFMVTFVERNLFKIVLTNIQKAIKEWNADQNNIYAAQYLTPLWVGNNEEADTNANQIKVDRSDAD